MWTSPARRCYSMARFWQSEVILVKLQSWGDAKGRALINANMVLIHHQLTSKVIQSNYREGEQHPRSNLTPDGHPAEQQVVFVCAPNTAAPKGPDKEVKYETIVWPWVRACTCARPLRPKWQIYGDHRNNRIENTELWCIICCISFSPFTLSCVKTKV